MIHLTATAFPPGLNWYFLGATDSALEGSAFFLLLALRFKGTWRWIGGTYAGLRLLDTGYTNWFPGEPGEGASGNCLVTGDASADWHDTSCTSTTLSSGFIVKFECPIGQVFGATSCVGRSDFLPFSLTHRQQIGRPFLSFRTYFEVMDFSRLNCQEHCLLRCEWKSRFHSISARAKLFARYGTVFWFHSRSKPYILQQTSGLVVMMLLLKVCVGLEFVLTSRNLSLVWRAR